MLFCLLKDVWVAEKCFVEVGLEVLKDNHGMPL